MLSVDKITKRRKIFICEKALPAMWHATRDEMKQLAHMTVTRKNSLMLAEYEIYKDFSGLKYKIVRRSGDFDTLLKQELIQSDCLITAMEDYLSLNKLKMEQRL